MSIGIIGIGPGFISALADRQQRERYVQIDDERLNLHHATDIAAKTSSISIQATVEHRGCVEFAPLQREPGKSRTGQRYHEHPCNVPEFKNI